MFWECLTGSAGITFSRLESKHCLDVVTDGLGLFFFSTQICMDPEQSAQWLHEDERLTSLPALYHPTWDPQL